MRVKMRRRYRDGARLTTREFVDQDWAHGMLLLREVEGRQQLGLWESRPGDATPPRGVLWRPELAACALDTISFAGVEHQGNRWCYQVWFCEVQNLSPDLSVQLIQLAATIDHEPS